MDDEEYGEDEFEQHNEDEDEIELYQGEQQIQESVSQQKSQLKGLNVLTESDLKKPNGKKQINSSNHKPPDPKKPNKAPLKKPDDQEKMVKKILQQHKEKEKKMKELEDKIYVQEQVEKRQSKERPKVISKQKLVFDKDLQEKLDDPNKNNQEKTLALMNDLAKKVDRKPPQINEKDLPKKIPIKQPPKTSEPKEKPREPDFVLAVGAGIKNKLEEDANSSKKTDQVRERTLFIEQKKAEKERLKKELAQLEIIKEKERQMVKESEDRLKKKNKILDQKKPEDYQMKKQEALIYEANKIEKSEKDETLRKQLLVQLRHLREEQQELNQTLQFEVEKNKQTEEQIKKLKLKTNVIEDGGRFTSFGINPKLKVDKKDISLIENAENSLEGSQVSLNEKLMAAQIGSKISEPTISEIIVNKIALQGISLVDVYHMLDADGDGILTMNEIKENINNLNLNLTDDECDNFIKLLDQNSDGVLTEGEFISSLTTTLEVQKEFVAIMGELKDINNPIVLDERKLDLQFRKRLIIKKLEIEKQKSQKVQSKYDRLVKSLKEAEIKVQAIKGAPADKAAHLKELKFNLESLRQEYRGQTDQKRKIEYQIKEKTELIEENIKILTDELTKKSEVTLQVKEQLHQLQIAYQKRELKNLAYARLRERFEKGVQDKNLIEQETLEKQKANNKNKLFNIGAGKELHLRTLLLQQSAILIQKFAKGRIMRKKMTMIKNRNLGIQKKFYQIFRPKILEHYKKCFAILIKMRKDWLVEKDVNKEREKIMYLQQMRMSLISPTSLQTKVTIPTPKKGILANLNPLMLVAVINLQKKYNKHHGKEYNPQKVYDCAFLTIEKKCSVCQAPDEVNIICRNCYNPLYCKVCFTIYHKNYNRRNHQFYELITKKNEIKEQLSEHSQDVFSQSSEEIEGASPPLQNLQNEDF